MTTLMTLYNLHFIKLRISRTAMKSVEADYESSKAGFSIGDIKPTLNSLVANSPVGNCLMPVQAIHLGIEKNYYLIQRAGGVAYFPGNSTCFF